jgi:hypothetical protein
VIAADEYRRHGERRLKGFLNPRKEIMATAKPADQLTTTHYLKEGKWVAYIDTRKFTAAAVVRLWPATITLTVAGQTFAVDALRFTGNLEYHGARGATFRPAATPTDSGTGKIRFTIEHDLLTNKSNFIRE